MKIITGFIYEWYDSLTTLKYIGRHEGTVDDGYTASGTIIKKQLIIRPSDFSRTILWESSNTTVEEIKRQEEYFLSRVADDELYYGCNRKYYNQVKNSNGYTSEDNPMMHQQVVNRMLATRKEKNLNNAYQNTVEKYGIEEWGKMQSQLKQGNTYGSGNKGKPKSEEHKKNIAESIRHLAADPNRVCGKNAGRKPAMPFEETLAIYATYGITGGAAHLNIKRDAFYSRVLLAKKKLN